MYIKSIKLSKTPKKTIKNGLRAFVGYSEDSYEPIADADIVEGQTEYMCPNMCIGVKIVANEECIDFRI